MTDRVAVKPRDEFARRRSSSHAGSTSELVSAAELANQKYDSPFDASLAAARKRTQHEKLWDIFASYALQLSSSEDPTRLRAASVIKLLQDCEIIDGSNSGEAKLIEKEVAIVCESFLKSHPSERDGSKKLTFAAFLALLLHFAKMSGDQDSSRAYDSLARTCIERQLKPRVRVVVTNEMDECKKVFAAFEEPLTKIFAYYASMTHARLEKLEPKAVLLSPPHMGYPESVAFSRMYGIIALGMLTTTEFAALFIDALAKAPATEYDRVLTYTCFCELLVRLARKVMASDVLAPSDTKLKALLQLMWLACASSSPRALKMTDMLKTDRVDVRTEFLVHFEKFWKRERYENYVGSRGGMIAGLEDDTHVTAGAGTSATGRATLPPPSPSRSPSRLAMTRQLSLCVQTPTATSSAASGGGKSPDAKKSPLQRRFTMSSPSSSPIKTQTTTSQSASPTKVKQQQQQQQQQQQLAQADTTLDVDAVDTVGATATVGATEQTE